MLCTVLFTLMMMNVLDWCDETTLRFFSEKGGGSLDFCFSEIIA